MMEEKQKKNQIGDEKNDSNKCHSMFSVRSHYNY